MSEQQQPQPYWLKSNHMALSAGVSPSTLSMWGITPIMVVGNAKYYSVQQLLENRRQHWLGEDGGKMTKAQADLDFVMEKRETQFIKNQILRKQYVDVGVLTEVIAGVGALIGAEMDAAALQLKRKHPSLDKVVFDDFDKILRRCMNAIAGMDEQLDELIEAVELEDEPSSKKGTSERSE